MNTPAPHSTEELAALYLSGAMTTAESQEFEERLAGGWLEAAKALLELEGAVRTLSVSAGQITPRPEIKAAIMAKLRDQAVVPRKSETKLPGLAFEFANDKDFRSTPFPGIYVRILNLDRKRKQFTCLMRLEPGAVYPSHPHDGPEECLVLDGEIIVGDVRMKKGDYQRAEPNSQHIEQRTETGALIYLSAPMSLLSFR